METLSMKITKLTNKEAGKILLLSLERMNKKFYHEAYKKYEGELFELLCEIYVLDCWERYAEAN